MSNTKYNFTVSVVDATGKEVFNSEPFLDRMIKVIPSTGSFSVTFNHQNKIGFSKALSLLDSSSNLLDCKVITQPSNGLTWNQVSVSHEGIPESVQIDFSSKELAIAFLYIAWIPALVAGNWKNLPVEPKTAFSKLLTFVQANGIQRLHTTGEGGKVIPLKDSKNLPAVITSVMTAKKSISVNLTK